ncbi:GSCOCG00002508001-RA-CDS, partial [Cotesia congregata]
MLQLKATILYLKITLIFFAIIISTNGETYKWKDYDVTSETLSKNGVKNFTKTLSRTVKGITTVDQIAKLTNETTKKIIFTDRLITTTNNGVVTLDRTLEKFNPL